MGLRLNCGMFFLSLCAAEIACWLLLAGWLICVVGSIVVGGPVRVLP
jgi:hypothetical protein